MLQYFCPSVYNWWIECWLLNVQWQILHAYTGQEQVLKYLRTIEKWGRGGISGATMFECHWKSIHYVIFNMDWQNSLFYSSYNSLSTLFFQNLQEVSNMEEPSTLQTCYLIWPTVRRKSKYRGIIPTSNWQTLLQTFILKYSSSLGTDHLTCRGLWFFVSFRKKISDNTRVRIFIFFVAQSPNFFSRIQH